jgi:hypothetical protein
MQPQTFAFELSIRVDSKPNLQKSEEVQTLELKFKQNIENQQLKFAQQKRNAYDLF